MFVAGKINTRLFFRHTVGMRGSKKQAEAEVVPISSLVEVEVEVEVEFVLRLWLRLCLRFRLDAV